MREFLLLKRAEPQWELIAVPQVQQMPAIGWKLRNLEQLARRTRLHGAAVCRSSAEGSIRSVRSSSLAMESIGRPAAASTRRMAHYMNLRRRKAFTSAAVSSNHSVLRRFSVKRRCQ
jgi:hypothetical protein